MNNNIHFWFWKPFLIDLILLCLLSVSLGFTILPYQNPSLLSVNNFSTVTVDEYTESLASFFKAIVIDQEYKLVI